MFVACCLIKYISVSVALAADFYAHAFSNTNPYFITVYLQIVGTQCTEFELQINLQLTIQGRFFLRYFILKTQLQYNVLKIYID